MLLCLKNISKKKKKKKEKKRKKLNELERQKIIKVVDFQAVTKACIATFWSIGLGFQKRGPYTKGI